MSITCDLYLSCSWMVLLISYCWFQGISYTAWTDGEDVLKDGLLISDRGDTLWSVC